MLTAREYNILLYFREHPEEYITSNKLATTLSVSDRTIKSDLATVRDYCQSLDFISLESKKGKGTKLIIHDLKEFELLLNNLDQSTNEESTSRIKKIVLHLLSNNKPITKYALQETFFISDSTLYQDMKQAEKLVKEYNLTLYYERE